jgi:uncharacterized protein
LLTPDQVAEFIRANPGIFNHYPDLLTSLQLPNPHGGHAISITERQVLAMREKNHALETKLAELIRFGEENDQLGGKVHQLACRLIAASDLEGVLNTLYLALLDQFAVPHVAVRLWGVAEASDSKEFMPVANELRDFVRAMKEPYCGHHPVYETGAWFGDVAPTLKSFAMLPLTHEGEAFGAIVLASEDGERFYPEMGTLYLNRIADLAAAAMARYSTFVRELHA